MRSIRWLNEKGDITIEWSEDRDEVMKKIIQERMNEGFTFFIVEGRKKDKTFKRVSDVKQIKDFKITMTDKEAEQMIGGLFVGNDDNDNIESVGKANTPDEVVKNDSVAVRPVVGG